MLLFDQYVKAFIVIADNKSISTTSYAAAWAVPVILLFNNASYKLYFIYIITVFT